MSRSGARKRVALPKEITDPSKIDFPTFLSKWNHFLGRPTPELHLRYAVWLEATMDAPQRHLQSFRMGGKSYVVCLYAVWRLFRDPDCTFIIISSTQKFATRNAGWIKSFLTQHPWTKHLVPQNDETVWQITNFTVLRSPAPVEHSIQALAVTGTITGSHCETEIICDDIESADNSRTQEARERIAEAMGEIKAIAPRALYVGTFHAGKNSIYLPMIADPEIPSIQIPIYTMPEGVEDTEENEDLRIWAWPEKFDSKRFRNICKGMTQGFIDSQYMCRPVDLNTGGLDLQFVNSFNSDVQLSKSSVWGDNRITAKLTTPDPADPSKQIEHSIVDLIAGWDPASGKKEDDSVLAIAGRSRDDKTFLLRTVALPPINDQGWKPQIDVILKTLKEMGITKIAVETNMNPTLPAELRMAAGDYPLQVISSHETITKEVRIRLALEATITRGTFWVHESVMQGEFAKQAGDFPLNCKSSSKAPNDYIDAAARAVQNLMKIPPGLVLDVGFRRHRIGHSGVTFKTGHAGGSIMDRIRAGRSAR